MKFIQLVKFNGSEDEAYGTEGECILINTSQIAKVQTEKILAEKTDEVSYKWLRVTYVGGKSDHVCPFDRNGVAAAPKAARAHDDESLLEWFEWVARDN